MTEKQMMHIAGRKIAYHWIKLYRPERINEWKEDKKPEELPGEFAAFHTVMQFMDGRGSKGYRLALLIEAIDIRETRQLCLGEPIPATLQEEALLVLEQAEKLFAN